jgi:cardiolipin-specific phospholipase
LVRVGNLSHILHVVDLLLGGYLSVAYALRYPERVNKLVLLSPAGVPRDPDNTEVPSRELTDEQHSGSATAETGTSGRVKEIKQKQATEKRKESRSRRLFTYLWEEGYSPFQVVRSSVFWGPLLVGKVRSITAFDLRRSI